MRNYWSVVAAGVIATLGLLNVPSAFGQRPSIVAAPVGFLYRSHGDTIWREEDTTAYRTVVRGDTLVTTRLINGRALETCTMKAAGGPGLPQPLTTTDTLGNTKPAVGFAGCSPGDPRVEMASWMSAQGRAFSVDSHVAPRSPPDPISYCTSSGVLLIQHRDTVRYVHGPMNAVPDTTVWLFTGDTTVQRLSPSPRLFGYTMANTIRGAMYDVNVETDRIAKGRPDLPGAPLPVPCSRRSPGP